MSSNYNFLNLDSFEFEQVCAEVLSIILDKNFRVFAPGPDGGVDIKQENGSDEIIGQAKRYKNASIDLVKELDKIKKKTDCKEYYFFISCSLTDNKKTEIFNVFKSYMADQSYIFDSIRLNALLEDEKYENVLKRHYKLWATSDKILNLLQSNNINIDTNTFFDNIKKRRKYYVETTDYFNALKVFEESRIVLIKGEAGVGKTTTSEMMVLNFLNKHPNAKFIYSSSGNIDNLRNSISINKDNVELVFIDDFLGDIYLNLKGDKINNITSFINYFKNTDRKYLIINTRVVILEDTLNKHIDFSNAISNIGIKEIEIKNITKTDKAKILYNHLYFSDLSNDVKKFFIDHKMYISIVNHENYNPRNIELICNNKQFILSRLTFDKYAQLVLEEQDKTWKHSFENNLDVCDRVLLHVLFSFNANFVRIDSLEKAFMHEAVGNPSIDTTVDVFSQSLKRLSGAFILITFFNTLKFVSFLNPSVKDCLSKIPYFTKESNFLYIDQYLFIWGMDEFLKSPFLDDIIFKNNLNLYNFESCNKFEFLALYFSKRIIKDTKLEGFYLSAISLDIYSVYQKIGDAYFRDIFGELMNDEYLVFYNLNNMSKEQLKAFVKNAVMCLDNTKLKEVISKIDNDFMLDILDDDIKEIIIQTTYKYYDKRQAIENSTYEDYDPAYERLVNVFDEERAKSYAVNDLYCEIGRDFSFLSDKYGFEITEEDIDSMIDSSDFSEKYNDYSEPDTYDDIDFDKPDFGEDCYEIFNHLLDD